jgi:signal transduction histidine kinase
LAEVGNAFNDLLDRLRDAFARLHDGYERQRRFAGDASHQLRTPLAAVLGQVQVALRRERPPEDYRRTLELVRAEAERLRQIVESLLRLAHPDETPLEAGPVDLDEWLRGHVSTWAAQPRVSDLALEIGGDEPVIVRAHPPLLAQVVDNLWENACKYSRPGTPIVIRLGLAPGWAELAVEDRGSGLHAEDAARVFEPFFRAEHARHAGQPGVGLGLAVAQGIAGRFGGSIGVWSEPGVGSRFTLRLPADRESGSPRPPPQRGREPIPSGEGVAR